MLAWPLVTLVPLCLATSRPQTWFYDAAPRHTGPPPKAQVCISTRGLFLALQLGNVIQASHYVPLPAPLAKLIVGMYKYCSLHTCQVYMARRPCIQQGQQSC
ncbi:hypothetical protein ACQKWADRAFT_298129 [Trichoderma austrokoningii]